MVPFDKLGMVSLLVFYIVTLFLRHIFGVIRLQICRDLENRVIGK